MIYYLLIVLIPATVGICQERIATARDIDFSVIYNLEGLEEGAEGNFTNACDKFEKAIKSYAQNQDAILNSKICHDLNLKTIHRETALYIWQCALSLKKSKFDIALNLIYQALFSNPDYFPVYIYLGKTHINLNNYDSARNNFKQAIQLAPDFAWAYYEYGKLLSSLSEYDLAIANFSHALELEPDFALCYFERGYAYSSKKEYDQAIADYERAMRHTPSLKRRLNEGLKIYEAYNNRGITRS